MSFIGKKINQAMNWENVEVSVREMADLIQQEIIGKCSDKDLIDLEKAMRKGWILGIGASNRFYPSFYADFTIRLRYNMLLHTLQEITLLDSVNKREYFIPGGKEYRNKLRRTVLRRIALEAERRENSDVFSVRKASYRESIHSDSTAPRQKTPILLYGLAVIGIIACLTLLWPLLTKPIFNETIPREKPELISTVQSGYLGEFTDMTVFEILEIFRGFYEGEVWSSETTNSGKPIVQVQFSNSDVSDWAVIQFQILNDEVFKIAGIQDAVTPEFNTTEIISTFAGAYYSQKCIEYMYQPNEIDKLTSLLNETDGSAFLYGAANNYNGDRSVLHVLFREEPANLSIGAVMSANGFELLQSETSAEETPEEAPMETTIPPETTEPHAIRSNTMSPFNSVAGNALASVMIGKNNFTMAKTGTHQSLFGITELMAFEFESYLTPTSFCVVDMDQDCTNEIIVGIDTDVDGFRVVLRYQDGIVYGYPFGFRGLKTVSTDGLITSSSSAFESPTSRLSFNGLSIDYYNLSYVEEQSALASWQDATWYDFTEENVGEFFPNMDVSFVLPSTPPPSTTTQQSETVETYITGYVMYGTGGLNIRSGPGMGYEQVGRLPEGEQVVITETTFSGNTQWGQIERGWISMDYIQQGIPSSFGVDAASMYAMDYVNGTTGNVVSRIGQDYIIAGGYSGSCLFYFGNNPDMLFGFVPTDWTDPKIHGSEPISVILLRGSAKINSYLSADMNKAQIDSVIWSIPGVQNVVSEQSYGAMWGNVYRYEIETSSSRILYMWYLDDGDNIDYPAGEVSISSK